eukprot:TRINITY_DN66917_c8_g1_i1.p1 TRINITY_DN66917_c8_g1~~TRINITY_DN66917_c8_g1_i1.p1  ORF type:complete len:641 (+),score=69.41 TRINITY_DN66917_c8_g1_i1:165-1925(+)
MPKQHNVTATVTITDLSGYPIETERMWLGLRSSDNGAARIGPYCRFPTDINGGSTITATCSLSVNSFAASQTLTLVQARICDSGQLSHKECMWFPGWNLKDLNSFMKPGAKKFTALPSVKVIQKGVTDDTPPVFEGAIAPHHGGILTVPATGALTAKIKLLISDVLTGVVWAGVRITYTQNKPKAGRIATELGCRMGRLQGACVIHVDRNELFPGFPGGPKVYNGSTFSISRIVVSDHLGNTWETPLNLTNNHTGLLNFINARLPIGKKLLRLPGFQINIAPQYDLTPPVVSSITVNTPNVIVRHEVVELRVTLQISDNLAGVELNKTEIHFSNELMIHQKRFVIPFKCKTHPTPQSSSSSLDIAMHDDDDDDDGDQGSVIGIDGRITFSTQECVGRVPIGVHGGIFNVSGIFIEDNNGNFLSACCSPVNASGISDNCGCNILQVLNSALPVGHKLNKLPAISITNAAQVDVVPPYIEAFYFPSGPVDPLSESIGINITVVDNYSGIDTVQLEKSGVGFHQGSAGFSPQTTATCPGLLPASWDFWTPSTFGVRKANLTCQLFCEGGCASGTYLLLDVGTWRRSCGW